MHIPAHKNVDHPAGQVAIAEPPMVRKMDNYLAVGIAEGFEEAANDEEFIAAWQYLHDTGLAYQLQGWFGRTAQQMLNEGLIVGHA